MKATRHAPLLALMLALGVASSAHAQSSSGRLSDATLIPVWNANSGKLEAVLQLEPTSAPGASARWRMGRNTLDAAFGLDAGDTLGLVCDRKTGLATAIGNLANHCMLAVNHASLNLTRTCRAQRSAGAHGHARKQDAQLGALCALDEARAAAMAEGDTRDQ